MENSGTVQGVLVAAQDQEQSQSLDDQHGGVL
jgi:hypothetical protein